MWKICVVNIYVVFCMTGFGAGEKEGCIVYKMLIRYFLWQVLEHERAKEVCIIYMICVVNVYVVFCMTGFGA